ncbi:ribonuclease H-like domain-containing protein [Mycena rosella]|uniref:Ribonuclease H-like domain-containing protein n=1 Tax=Mycena rosella TaxID=1033263 RepID=A0AAD7F7U7_MYCRO|nr:ribonuclease H-like domain-containing protein [Mycena rosella]
MVTLLFDGWEDKLRRSLYGTVGTGMDECPSLISLDNMSGYRGSADKYMETIVGGLEKMEMADAKNVIALTTDNPSVMQSFRRKFQARFPWVLVFACFLHGLNTIIGKIVAFPGIKKIITATATIVTFFNSSHYWGGQLEEEAKAFKVGRSLKSRTESRWYSLILQALSAVSHKHPLIRVCTRPDAQKRTNGFAPITPAVIKLVMDTDYWAKLDQLIRICKPLVDAIDCMLELIRCARHMASFEGATEDDLAFTDHARSTFSHEFHAMNTDIHTLALFLHPRCRKLAISQVAKAKSFEQLCQTALVIAQSWGWDSQRAGRLLEDLKLYNACKAPFSGSSKDARTWWESLPVSGDDRPLKTLAIVLFSVVPHAAEVERLFSGLSGVQGVKRCNLSVPTFEILGKLRSNYSYYIYLQDRAKNKSTHRKHGHMHTRTEPGLDTNLANDLLSNFTWTPPLIVENVSDDLDMRGIEEMSEDEINAAFDNWDKDLAAERATRAALPIAKMPVDVGLVYDYTELDRIDADEVTTVFDDEVTIHVGGTADVWDPLTLLTSKGITST